MPTMNQEKADELKYKIESMFEEYANFGAKILLLIRNLTMTVNRACR